MHFYMPLLKGLYMFVAIVACGVPKLFAGNATKLTLHSKNASSQGINVHGGNWRRGKIAFKWL